MADLPQIEYEHTTGNSIQLFTNDLRIEYTRPKLKIEDTVDGEILVTDTGASRRVFSCSARITGAQLYTFDGWLTGSITYSGDFPRLKKVYFDGTNYLENVEVAITSFMVSDIGLGRWLLSISFTEKTK